MSRNDYLAMKRKSLEGDDRHSKRRRSIEAIEAEMDELKMKIRALQDDLCNERNRKIPSPVLAPSPTLDDIFCDMSKMIRNSPTFEDVCCEPCPITPALSVEGSDIDEDDLMMMLQGSELFA